MEHAEDVANLAPAPVFVDDTGRRHRRARRAGRVLLVAFSAYIGLVVMGFSSDPRLGPLHLPTIGFPDLGLAIPPAPPVLGEQATRTPAAAEIEVSAAGAVSSIAGDTGVSGPSAKPAGVAPGPGSVPTGRVARPGTTTTSTSTTTTSLRTDSPTTTATTAPSTTTTTLPTAPGQGLVAAKGPDGSGAPGRATEPPGQQRKTTTTTGG